MPPTTRPGPCSPPFTDTTLVWTLSGITVALMTLPNLIGILWLHKEVKQSVGEYWEKRKKNANL